MPARRMRQKAEHKERFRQLTREKVAHKKDNMKAAVDEQLPSWAAWALKPVASFMFDRVVAHYNAKGEAGEGGVFFNLWLLLPNAWIILDDVVLEPKPDEFIQLDHVLIGPPGVFLVETKVWDGAFVAHNDNWKRKQGNRWVRYASPTRQSLRHLSLFTHWVRANLRNGLPGNPEEWIYPNVVFTRAKWLKTEDCSVPVFQGAPAFAWHVRRQTRREVLPPELVDRIPQALADAGPCGRAAATKGEVAVKGPGRVVTDEIRTGSKLGAVAEAKTEASKEQNHRPGVRVKEGSTRRGRPFVKVYGSHEDALRTHREWKEKGRRPTECKADRYSSGAWYFYVDDGDNGATRWAAGRQDSPLPVRTPFCGCPPSKVLGTLSETPRSPASKGNTSGRVNTSPVSGLSG